MLFNTLKVIHIFSMVAWMAGLLYLPRLFVYHVGVAAGSDLDRTLRVMERRLLNVIMGPAMAVSWLLGLVLTALSPYAVWEETWFHGKILADVIMSGMHAAMVVWQKAFEANENRRGQTFYRMMNEVPTVLLIVIILMVVVKPF